VAVQRGRAACSVRLNCFLSAPLPTAASGNAAAIRSLADCEVNSSALGWLIIPTSKGYLDKNAVAKLLGPSAPLGKLGEIAQALLEPLADDALIAQAEGNEL